MLIRPRRPSTEDRLPEPPPAPPSGSATDPDVADAVHERAARRAPPGAGARLGLARSRRRCRRISSGFVRARARRRPGRRDRPARSSRSILAASIASCAAAAAADRSPLPTPRSTSPRPHGRRGAARSRGRNEPAVLFRAAAILRARRVELAALEVFEAGKPIAEADADVCEAIDFCEYYGREALRLAARRVGVGQVARRGEPYSYEPRGIGVVISPWNFPLAIPAGHGHGRARHRQRGDVQAGRADARHRAGAWSRSSTRPACPPGVLAFLPGIGEDVGASSRRAPVGGVRRVHRLEGGRPADHRARRRWFDPGQRHVKRVIAEMGGKNPIVVDTDADLDVAVPAIAHSAFAYAGQKCSAASARDRRSTPCSTSSSSGWPAQPPSFRSGPAQDLRTVCGPLIDADAYERVSAVPVAGARDGRRRRRARRDVPPAAGTSGRCVAVTDDARSPLATDEIFGPVLTVLRARDFDHAIALANDTDYALTAGVFSRSPSRIAQATGTLRAGNVYVNRGITGARRRHASPSAGPGSRAWAPRRVGPTTCCSSSRPAWSPRTPSARASHRHPTTSEATPQA